jgi:hypothetical protein
MMKANGPRSIVSFLTLPVSGHKGIVPETNGQWIIPGLTVCMTGDGHCYTLTSVPGFIALEFHGLFTGPSTSRVKCGRAHGCT